MKCNEEWMEIYKNGDKAGFTQLYERLYEPLYCFLYRYTQEEQLSIDIVHDTFEILQKKSRHSILTKEPSKLIYSKLLTAY